MRLKREKRGTKGLFAAAVCAAAAFLSLGCAAFAAPSDKAAFSAYSDEVVANASAIYGYTPNPASASAGVYAEAIDWTDETQVAFARAQRLARHKKNKTLYGRLAELESEGRSTEQIARVLAEERNALFARSFSELTNGGVPALRAYNAVTYGNEDGPSAESLYALCGSWEGVIGRILDTNVGLDICLGLYDEYGALLYADRTVAADGMYAGNAGQAGGTAAANEKAQPTDKGASDEKKMTETVNSSTSGTTSAGRQKSEASSTGASAAGSAMPGESAVGEEDVYVVQEGDFLSMIAKKKLGNGHRWNEIYKKNEALIENPDLIFPGQRLILFLFGDR